MKQYYVFASSAKRVRLFTSLDIANRFTTKESMQNEIWMFQGERFASKSDIKSVKAGVYRYLSQEEKEAQGYE